MASLSAFSCEPDPVDLARQPGLTLGAVSVDPPLRQLRRGREEVLVEPRVMQVLVALARARGEIVTRDDLVRDCWEGRFVSEDAINRALSRLRKLSEGIGRDAFRIETVARVGYRLRVAGDWPTNPPAGPPGLQRRRLLAGGLAAAIALAGGSALRLGGSARRRDPRVEPLMRQALIALSQGTREGQNQAIGLYRQVVAVDPGLADGWGALGNAYSYAAFFRPQEERLALRARARAAGRRALAIDPDNGYGQVALATAVPQRGHWLAIESAVRRALARQPDNEQTLFALMALLSSVGRLSEALALLERVSAMMPPAPDLLFFRINLLWSLDRMEECDRVMDEAASVYPTHPAIWFTRFYVLMYSGRANAAIGLAEDSEQRPTDLAEAEVARIVRLARAMAGTDRAAADAIVGEHWQLAHQGAGRAENAIQISAALGRVDTAFAIAQAYYFGRGFAIPEVRFSRESGTYSALEERLTAFLFRPPARTMRKDPRFATLVAELGLGHYWRDSGSRPDYLA